MAWRFEPGEPLTEAFRRVALEEVAKVEAGVKARDADGATTTHEARQSFKRLRALLRLARPALGEDYEEEARRWRDAGRQLAALRDGKIVEEAFDRVVTDSGDLPADGVDALRAQILGGRMETDASETKRILRSVLSDLRGAKRRLAVLDWPETADDLRRGLRASQARLRQSWRRACTHRTPEALHNWRKRAKDQSAQLRLLRIVAPEEAKARREVQKKVAELLGDEHDLSLLAERLSSAAIPPAMERTRARLLKIVGTRRKALRRKAFKAAQEGCSEKPKRFASLLEVAWREASEN